MGKERGQFFLQDLSPHLKSSLTTHNPHPLPFHDYLKYLLDLAKSTRINRDTIAPCDKQIAKQCLKVLTGSLIEKIKEMRLLRGDKVDTAMELCLDSEINDIAVQGDSSDDPEYEMMDFENTPRPSTPVTFSRVPENPIQIADIETDEYPDICSPATEKWPDPDDYLVPLPCSAVSPNSSEKSFYVSDIEIPELSDTCNPAIGSQSEPPQLLNSLPNLSADEADHYFQSYCSDFSLMNSKTDDAIVPDITQTPNFLLLIYFKDQ